MKRYLTQAEADKITDILLAVQPAYDTNGPGFGPQSKLALQMMVSDLLDGQLIIGPIPANNGTVPDASPFGSLILSVSKPFVGLYETVNNTEWAMAGSSDRTEAVAFKALLQGIGWEPPESYCIAACKGWWKAAFAQAGRTDWAKYADLLDLSVLGSYNQCNRAGLITHNPQPGAIAFMQHGGSGEGHAWLYRGTNGAYALSREANTSLAPDAPSDEDRDGGCVTDKQRLFDFTPTSGLHLKGFLNPPA